MASVPMRELVLHAVGGGWGADQPSDTAEQVAVIRGADFPAVAVGETSTVPVRWEDSKKVPQRALRPGDIILEISGGTSDRPTGRTVYVSKRLLASFTFPVIPASFCRLVRIDPTRADSHFVYWWLQGMHADGRAWGYQNRSTGIANFQFEHFLDTERVDLPPLPTQRAVAATLGALDDKIESSRRARALLRKLGHAKYLHAVDQAHQVAALEDLTVSIARGVAPKYADYDPTAPLVVNQRCVRDGWVSLSAARRMHDRGVAPARRASSGDVLVNSTGTGTLGRLARWHEGDLFVDGHVSVVKPDPERVPPTVLAYALLGRQTDIEELATGSTGQTELSPAQLGAFKVAVPSASAAATLEADLLALEEKAAQIATEIGKLEALRDALRPELLSGRIRADVGGPEA